MRLRYRKADVAELDSPVPTLPRLSMTSNATPRFLAIRRIRRISSSLVIHRPRDPISRNS